jgi:NADPH2:quinone reductase
MLLEDIAVPSIGDGELLVDVAMAGTNYIDTYIRTGLYPNPPPHVLGKEGSGVVTKVGEKVTGFAVGDRVAFLASGTYAQQCAVPASRSVKLADNVSFAQGAAVTLMGLTAHYLVKSTYELKPGDICLVHAGAGGTGGLIIQMAKAIGATVIATVGSDVKVEIAKGVSLSPLHTHHRRYMCVCLCVYRYVCVCV